MGLHRSYLTKWDRHKLKLANDSLAQNSNHLKGTKVPSGNNDSTAQHSEGIDVMETTTILPTFEPTHTESDRHT